MQRVRMSRIALLAVALVATGCAGPGVASPTAHRGAPAADAVLNAATIVDRCLPQLDAGYRPDGSNGQFYDRPTQANTTLANPGIPHHVGDLASFLQNERSEKRRVLDDVLCRIPAAGHTHDQVPAATFVPSPSDPAQLRSLCTEADATGGGVGVHPDFRSARIVAQAFNRHRGILILGMNQPSDNHAALFTCRLDKDSRFIALTHKSRSIAASGSHGSGEPVDSYLGAGATVARAHKVVVTDEHGVARSFPVGNNGVYAFLLRFPHDAAAASLHVRVLDRSGKVLSRQSWDNVALACRC